MTSPKLPKLDLNITNRCNLRCAHCAFNSGVRTMPELTLSKLQQILTETRALGGERIDLTGGEPTLRTDLDDILRCAKRLGFKVELVTNGSTLDRGRIDRLLKLRLDSVALSLDGASWRTHDRIRHTGRERYSKLLGVIQSCAAAGLKTKVNTLVTAANLEEITGITELAIGAGAYEHGLYYFTPVGRGAAAAEQSVEPRRWLEFIRTKLPPYRGRIKLSVEVPFLERELWHPGLGCIALTEPYHLQILPDGRVYPCAILASYSRALADLHHSGVADIWKNRELWEDYGGALKREVLEKNGSSCVRFQGFNAVRCAAEGLVFVCPLRKFSADALLHPRGRSAHPTDTILFPAGSAAL